MSPRNTDSGPDRVSFSHFKEPWLRVPDYTLRRDGAGQDLVTSYEYDALGRVSSRVTPKGNVGRPLDANGNLPASPIDTLYQTTWSYYAVGEQAAPDAQCGAGPQTAQGALLRQLASPGLAPVTTVYDAAGRSLSVDSGTRVACRSYSADGRLAEEGAKKDSEGALTMTTYTYDPDGNVLAVSEGGAPEAVTNVYNEAGWLLETEDASAAIGAKARPAYDIAGNVAQRVVQLPNGGASYTSLFEYDNENRVISQMDPAGRTYGFLYDSRDFLYAINYPNQTFLWRSASDTGLVTAVHVRHGQVTTPGVEPADSDPIVEYVYAYFQNGQRKSETRTGGSGGAPLGVTGLTSYAYDPVGRLEQVTFPGSLGSRRYCFDRNSNRTGYTASAGTACSTLAATYTYSTSAPDRLESVAAGTTTAYTYDADGNVTGRGGTVLSWGRYGRHSAATIPGPNGLVGVDFTVDGTVVGTATGASPFTTPIDTSTIQDGWHTIGAVAVTAAGNRAAAPTRVVKVANAPGDSPPSVSLTAPTAGSTLTGTTTVSATASDNIGVAAVQFRRDGVDLDADTTSPYSVTWDTSSTPNGAHTLTAVAVDTAGNATTSAAVAVTVTNGGLVAAYAFEEAAGATVTDGSGTGNTGTISGATRTTAGKNGKALSFDGTNDLVTVPDHASLDLTNGMTVEAWVYPSQLGSKWRTILFKERPAGSAWRLYGHAGSFASQPTVFVLANGALYSASGTSTLPLNVWSHVAATFDGSNARLYVNGSLVATRAAPGALTVTTGPLTLGGNNVWGEWLKGVLDDVRVYDKPLTQTQIQADMSTPVSPPPDRTAPTVAITAPSGGVSVNGSVTVSATASDNVGVAAVQFRRDGVDIGADTTSPYSVTWDTTSTPNGAHTLTAVALDAAGNATTSTGVTITVGETIPPTVPGTPTVAATPGTIQLSWTASSDASGIAYYRVHRSTVSGFTPSAATEIGQTTLTSYTDNGDGTTAGLPTGAWYFYKIVALDGAGNASSPSVQNFGRVLANTSLPQAALTAPTPVSGSTVAGSITVASTASSSASGDTTVSYGFDPVGFRFTRTLNGTTTRYVLSGLIETNSSGTITLFDVDGPLGDLAHYTAPPTPSQQAVRFLYNSAHGDFAAESNITGSRTAAYTYDPFGAALEATPANTTTERWTGEWDKKLDTTSGLIEMGARPYDPALGRFLAVDPIIGGALNDYDFAGQDPINVYDLTGESFCDVFRTACEVVPSVGRLIGKAIDIVVKYSPGRLIIELQVKVAKKVVKVAFTFLVGATSSAANAALAVVGAVQVVAGSTTIALAAVVAGACAAAASRAGPAAFEIWGHCALGVGALYATGVTMVAAGGYALIQVYKDGQRRLAGY